MTRAELEALAVRVETEEPSRELDYAIGEAIRKPDQRGFEWHGHFTTSLDAAVTLVPEGWEYLVQGNGIALLKRLGVSHLLPGYTTARSDAPGRPAAALTAAVLRALAQEQT